MDTREKLSTLVKELNKAKVIAFDTETTSTEEMKAEIVGISLAIKEGEGIYIPIGHHIGQNLSLDEVIEVLARADDQSEDWQDCPSRQI